MISKTRDVTSIFKMSKHSVNSHKRQLKQPILAGSAPGTDCFSGRKSASLITHHLSPTTRGKATHGFTLLEVILAVTIAGALLAAAVTLMVSITDAWLKRQDRHFFEDHVDGVAEFVQACFSSAGMEIALEGTEESDSTSNNGNEGGNGNGNDSVNVGNTRLEITDGNGSSTGNATSTTESTSEGGSLLRTSEDPIGWGKPPGFAEYKDPLLNFALKDTPPLLVQTGDAPIIGVDAFLYFEKDEGLSLLWYTALQEESEEIDDLRRTPISDLVTQITYIYWDQDFEKWEEEEQPMDGEGDKEFILPRFIKLIFEYEDVTKERIITIPVPSKSALLF